MYARIYLLHIDVLMCMCVCVCVRARVRACVMNILQASRQNNLFIGALRRSESLVLLNSVK
jgi:hypothetical protein